MWREIPLKFELHLSSGAKPRLVAPLKESKDTFLHCFICSLAEKLHLSLFWAPSTSKYFFKFMSGFLFRKLYKSSPSLFQQILFYASLVIQQALILVILTSKIEHGIGKRNSLGFSGNHAINLQALWPWTISLWYSVFPFENLVKSITSWIILGEMKNCIRNMYHSAYHQFFIKSSSVLSWFSFNLLILTLK